MLLDPNLSHIHIHKSSITAQCTTPVDPSNSLCYWISSVTTMEYSTAILTCQTEGGQLATIDSQQAMDFVYQELVITWV